MRHIDELSEQVIGAAIAVHRELGPGRMERIYERCLALELRKRGIPFERQKHLPVRFHGHYIDLGFRCDLLVDRRLVVELKAASAVLPMHRTQLLCYVKLSGCHLGLLINFKVPLLRLGITRIVWGDLNAPPDRR